MEFPVELLEDFFGGLLEIFTFKHIQKFPLELTETHGGLARASRDISGGISKRLFTEFPAKILKLYVVKLIQELTIELLVKLLKKIFVELTQYFPVGPLEQ